MAGSTRDGGLESRIAPEAALNTQSIDTTAEVEEILVSMLRRLSDEDRLRRMYELTESARALAADRIRRQYGPATAEREVTLRLAALHLGRELMVKAFGWDPEREGW